MKNLILVSLVSSVAARSTGFHFKGYYRGVKVEKILLDENKFSFEIGEVYLLYLKEVNIISSVLYARAEKIKKLTEVRF